jgi:SulP family sulfate permease
MAESPERKNLLVIGSGVNFMDMAGAELLSHLAHERAATGGALYYYDMKEDICSHFKFLDYLLDIGIDNVFVSKKDAIASIYSKLDRSICDTCTARIFIECQMSAASLESAGPGRAA